MPTFKPFQQYSEYNVINGVFQLTGVPPINKGTFVKISSGFLTDQHLRYEGNVGGGGGYGNTVSQRWGTPAIVKTCEASGDNTIGMTLYDYKETDENGEKLIFDPRKAAELEVILSGQSMPIVTKGLFLYSGVDGTPTAGNPAYLSTNGQLNTSGTLADHNVTRVGTFLGPKDSKGVVLLYLNL